MPPDAELSVPPNLHVHGAAMGAVLWPREWSRSSSWLPRGWARLWRCCDGPVAGTASIREEQINSLYFDTPDLDQHERSLAGEFAKDKVRIRWYGSEHDPHGSNGRPGRLATRRDAVPSGWS